MCEGRARKSAVATADANEKRTKRSDMILEKCKELAAFLKSQGLPEDVALKCYAVLEKAEFYKYPVYSTFEALLTLWDWLEDEAVIIKRKRFQESFEVEPALLVRGILAFLTGRPLISYSESEEKVEEYRKEIDNEKNFFSKLRAAGKWKPFVGMIANQLEEALQSVHFETKQDKWLLMYKIIDFLEEDTFVRPEFDLEKIEGWNEYKTIDTEKAKWINSCLTAYKKAFGGIHDRKPEDIRQVSIPKKDLQTFRDCWER